MSSRALADADPVLASAFLSVRARYCADHPDREVLITCTYRSPEEQFALYQLGREPEPNAGGWVVADAAKIVTQCDGRHQKSKHNLSPARAIDCAITVAGKVVWDATVYAPLGPLATAVGLVWGGDWPHLRDMPHLELPD